MKETPNLKLKIPEPTDAVDNPMYFEDAFNKLDNEVSPIFIISKGSDIPIVDRQANAFYLKITDVSLSGKDIKVSPNMGLKLP